jgi:hypothetical protein
MRLYHIVLTAILVFPWSLLILTVFGSIWDRRSRRSSPPRALSSNLSVPR